MTKLIKQALSDKAFPKHPYKNRDSKIGVESFDEGLTRTAPERQFKAEEGIFIEGISVKELGDVFCGYYISNCEEVTKIINLFRKQGRQEAIKIVKDYFDELKTIANRDLISLESVHRDVTTLYCYLDSVCDVLKEKLKESK